MTSKISDVTVSGHSNINESEPANSSIYVVDPSVVYKNTRPESSFKFRGGGMKFEGGEYL